MPNYPNAAEVAAVSGNPVLRGLINATIDETPALNHFYVSEMEGTRILTLGIVALPTGGFLNMGEGYSNGHTETALVEFNASRIGGAVEAQESPMLLYNRAKERAIKSGMVPDYLSLQAIGRTKGQFLTLENQIFKGVSNDAKGFPGLKALTPFVSGNVLTTSETAQDSDWLRSVINAAGTTSSTASSIYLVKYGELDCSLQMGGNGGMSNFLNLPAPERTWRSFTDPVDGVTKLDWFWHTAAEGYIGLSVAGGNEANASRRVPQRSVRRICNVTADSGKTCTDALLQKGVMAFPSNMRPDAIFMSYRSRDQLQADRSTVVLQHTDPAGSRPSGAATPRAPIPTHFEGIPIIVTPAIGNTDAIES